MVYGDCKIHEFLYIINLSCMCSIYFTSSDYATGCQGSSPHHVPPFMRLSMLSEWGVIQFPNPVLKVCFLGILFTQIFFAWFWQLAEPEQRAKMISLRPIAENRVEKQEEYNLHHFM